MYKIQAVRFTAIPREHISKGIIRVSVEIIAETQEEATKYFMQTPEFFSQDLMVSFETQIDGYRNN